MKAKDLVTWGLILYLIYKASPQSALAAEEAAETALDNCIGQGSMITSQFRPRWIRSLALNRQNRFTIEGIS